MPDPMTPNPEKPTERRYVRICRNPHEPFYWDTASPDAPCPGQGCEDGLHETYVLLASHPNQEALTELIERFNYLATLSNSPHIWEKAAEEVRSVLSQPPSDTQPKETE